MRGFSMIELLVAVIILGVGLLGLAISLPATISIQRAGSDRTQGVTVARSAKAYLATRPDLTRIYEISTGPGIGTSGERQVGFGAMLSNDNWSREPDYFWGFCGEYIDTYNGLPGGTIEVFDDALNPSDVRIHTADRLYPSGESGADPRFIWDFVARRLPIEGLSSEQRVQVAVFVRRIDQNIRVPDGTTLYQALTAKPTQGPINAVPCAVDDVSAGRVTPRNDGRGEYARPVVLQVEYDPENPDRIKVPPFFGSSTSTIGLVLAQPGQRIVDNLGNVYRVLRVDEDEDDVLIIDPPVPASVAASSGGPNVADHRRLRQIAFVPQIPVAVEVFDIPLKNAVTWNTGSGLKP
jgi:prepilin-type N-terminal cleavage/methylation domain-containing protein